MVECDELRSGMPVVARDGSVVGHVQHVFLAYFLMNRVRHDDLFVPIRAVVRIDDRGQVVLDVASTEVERQGWPIPSSAAAVAAQRSECPPPDRHAQRDPAHG